MIQVTISCDQRDAAKLELVDAADKHRSLVMRMGAEHREEIAKITAANQQYQQLVREQSQKAASQEKSTSSMFEQTLKEMKEMMERSRETRERERQTGAALLESSNMVAETQKRELENMQCELTKMTEQLSKAELKLEEMRYSLADAQEQSLSMLAEKQKLVEAATVSQVDLRFDALCRQQLARVLWRVWQAWSLRAHMRCRNQHIARVHGEGRMQRQRVADVHALFSSWRNFLRLLWRGVGIRTKCHSRTMRTAWTGWTQIRSLVAARACVLNHCEVRRTRTLVLDVLGCMHRTTNHIKRRRARALHLAANIDTQGVKLFPRTHS